VLLRYGPASDTAPSAETGNRTGTLLGVLNTSTTKPHVQIIGRDGHLVLDLGEAELGALQP
jgi:hypothetical protein